MAEFKPLQGMVTSNVRGSTYHPKTAEELQNERMQQQRAWQIEDRDWQVGEQERQRQQLAREEKLRYQTMLRDYRQAFNLMQTPKIESDWRLWAGAKRDPNTGAVLFGHPNEKIMVPNQAGAQMVMPRNQAPVPQDVLNQQLSRMWAQQGTQFSPPPLKPATYGTSYW
jgi:hypothetical protein